MGFSLGSLIGGGAGFLLGGPAGAAIGASLGGGLDSQQATQDAVGAQTASAAQADATQRYMYDQTRADNAPFRQTGLAANNALSAMMKNGQFDRKFSAQDLANDPVYNSGLKFGLDQGTQGINRQAAAGGSFLSGATLKALTKYGNDYGSTKANESYNRFNNDQTNQYNRYAGLSGAGQQATNQVSAAGQNMANNVSQNQMSAGNARASGYVGGQNAMNNAIGGAYNIYQNNNLLGMLGGNSKPYDVQFNGTGAWR
jgi:hypothetical protein